MSIYSLFLYFISAINNCRFEHDFTKETIDILFNILYTHRGVL